MNTLPDQNNLDIRTVGDSRGYLWRIILDKDRGLGRIEKISGLTETQQQRLHAIDGSEHHLIPGADVSEYMHNLTHKIESRFETP